MSAESSRAQLSRFLDPSEAEAFQKAKYPAYYWCVVLHELLGHGTGRMMVEEPTGKFNFDPENPPTNPLTGKPIVTWYKPGQTWTGQFEDLATTVDECRAELVGAYLMDDVELLRLFGFDEKSEITAAAGMSEICSKLSIVANKRSVTYNIYQQLGVGGLRGLANFNIENKVSGCLVLGRVRNRRC